MILTQIFYNVDNFCKNYEKEMESLSIPANISGLIKRKSGKMSLSDMITVLVYFHHSGYRTFKKYYKDCADLKGAFDGWLSYNRFVELIPSTIIPMISFMNLQSKDKCTGIGFIDSTSISVCHNLRISRNRVFAGMAKRGKTSTGWFYGFKLHLVINQYGEIVSFMVTPGNVADSKPSVVKSLLRKCYGKVWGDRGYLSKALFRELFAKGIKLITKLKANMKNKLMDLNEKLMLNKRGIIESVNGLLKSSCQIEHSRHRSPANFLANLISGLVAYSFLQKKPSLRSDSTPILKAFS